MYTYPASATGLNASMPLWVQEGGHDAWIARLKDPQALASSDPRIITSVIGPDEIHLYESRNHHLNWLECVKSRRQPIAPVEVAHRSCSACLIHHIAMKLERKVFWDPRRERFRNDDAANAMVSRPQRPPYVITATEVREGLSRLDAALTAVETS